MSKEGTPVIRAKVRVGVNTPSNHEGEKIRETINAFGVYSEDPESENRKWAKATPSISVNMSIDNPGAWDKLEEGKEYYLDFIPVAD